MANAVILSIIVPVRNEAANIEALMLHLHQLGTEAVEIIVVDAGSEDGSAAIAAQYAMVLQAARGRARQMNAGAARARGELLLFLHADTRLPDNAVALIRQACAGGYRWGRFAVRLSGSHWLFRIIERMMNWRSCLTRVATGDQAIFVEAALFHQVGGYPDIALMEDIALSKSLRRQAKMKCLDAAVVTSSRRWQQHGIVRTVLKMWWLRALYVLGVSPEQLARMYD